MKILIGLLLLGILLQAIELKQFRVTTYKIHTDKVKQNVKILVLSDLHGKQFGDNNSRLFKTIYDKRPDVIVSTGDMISCLQPKEFERTEKFLISLTKIAPVYYGIGNHELYLALQENLNSELYMKYRDSLQNAGVHFLDNSSVFLPDNNITLMGLSLPVSLYEKRKKQKLSSELLTHLLPEIDCQDFSYRILIAHNPSYADVYSQNPVDLILSGHTHGGLIRFPGKGSLISPELTLNPKYDGGFYNIKSTKLIVSKGLGTHTFPIRILDRAELVEVDLTNPYHNL